MWCTILEISQGTRDMIKCQGQRSHNTILTEVSTTHNGMTSINLTKCHTLLTVSHWLILIRSRPTLHTMDGDHGENILSDELYCILSPEMELFFLVNFTQVCENKILQNKIFETFIHFFYKHNHEITFIIASLYIM